MGVVDDARALLRRVLVEGSYGEAALVSSFGAESAALLHLAAGIDRTTPVIFLDTEKLFPETLAYRDRLVDQFGLIDVRVARPAASALARQDRDGTLSQRDPDLCCWVRKVEPLDQALEGFSAWITGRKRYQADTRRMLPAVETDEIGRWKVNPLAGWSAGDVASYMEAHALPAHPLVARGYRSIGCEPCTRPTREGEDPRAGRWAGRGKIECGIHLRRAGAASVQETVG